MKFKLDPTHEPSLPSWFECLKPYLQGPFSITILEDSKAWFSLDLIRHLRYQGVDVHVGRDLDLPNEINALEIISVSELNPRILQRSSLIIEVVQGSGRFDSSYYTLKILKDRFAPLTSKEYVICRG